MSNDTECELLKKYIYKTLSGKEFKELFPILANNLIKLTNKSEVHNGYKFADGPNVDPVKFDPYGECRKGGFYFTDVHNFYCWTYYGLELMYYYRKVQLEDDCKVYIEENKMKTDKFILGNKSEISLMDVWNDELFFMKAVKYNAENIKYVNGRNVLLQLKAVKQNGNAIKHIENPSEAVQLEAVKQNGCAISYIENPSEEV
ncbi:MAG: hypothetical protein EBQ92_07170 [Proteobacteria bacterium]|nr:hypothetical protein [Pseudomonadota bacterium]